MPASGLPLPTLGRSGSPRNAAEVESARVKVLVANDSREVEKALAKLSGGGWLGSLVGNRGAPRYILTCYYPYYFQSWRVKAPKSFGRTAKIRVVTGVNGMSRSTGPAEAWPEGEELEAREEQVIRPRTSEAEASELMREYLDKFVARRYRPNRSPDVEKERFALIYVPYYVCVREGQPVRKAALVEGMTGTVGRVKDVPEILEMATSAELLTTVGEKERSG